MSCSRRVSSASVPGMLPALCVQAFSEAVCTVTAIHKYVLTCWQTKV